ncbi:hypothetical protein ACWDMY_34610, partial [Streptomyces globisporus]
RKSRILAAPRPQRGRDGREVVIASMREPAADAETQGPMGKGTSSSVASTYGTASNKPTPAPASGPVRQAAVSGASGRGVQ